MITIAYAKTYGIAHRAFKHERPKTEVAALFMLTQNEQTGGRKMRRARASFAFGAFASKTEPAPSHIIFRYFALVWSYFYETGMPGLSR